jgi:hypothetical protein
MKKQSITPASTQSAASNSSRKGLQQYFTPEPWAAALGAAWPEYRKTLADLHCGNGQLARGLSNDTTREVMGNDLDPTASLGGPVAWGKSHPGMIAPITNCSHGDILDLYPLLLETETRFDLLALNPPFSLNWPLELLPEPLRKGLTGKTIDSTHATLRMLPSLLTEKGEAMLIANQSTLERIYQDHPTDFTDAWLWASIPNFFPGVDPSLRIGVIYFSGNTVPMHLVHQTLHPKTLPDLAVALAILRAQYFTGTCISQPWESTSGVTRAFLACAAEMERRRDPSASQCNVTLDSDGRLRTWVSAFQERTTTIDSELAEFLRSINRKHPLELTLQRGARQALQHVIDCGIWTIDPIADDTLRQAIASYDQDRAPLSPVSDVQRIGWIDDAEELTCVKDFLHFQAGQSYPLTTETIEWKKTENRPRYHAGKRDTEEVLVRGTDLRLTLHPQGGMGTPTHFIFNPDKIGSLQTVHSLETLAAHFALPVVPDITSIKAEQYAANLALLDELETITP